MAQKNTTDKIQDTTSNDPKEKMLAALAKKQKGQNTGKSPGTSGGLRIGAGQTAGFPPKMHRRKSGSS
jgi:hypothetical protein